MAENDNGIGDASATHHPVKVSEEPGPPCMFICSEIAKSMVKLQWSKPDYDGGSEIVEYIIEQQKHGECSSINGTRWLLLRNISQTGCNLANAEILEVVHYYFLEFREVVYRNQLNTPN